jgi:hypothetical protein
VPWTRPTNLFATLLGMAIAVGCGPPASPRAVAIAERYPPFTPEEAVLFDDTISTGSGSSDIDPKLAERTRRADSVIPGRVTTVSRERPEAERSTFTLLVAPTGPALAGATRAEPVTLPVSSGSPTFPMLAVAGPKLVGARVILFFKTFNQEGFTIVHWHAAPDTPAVRAAIEQAKALASLSGR